MSKKTTIVLFGFSLGVILLIIGFFIFRHVYEGFLSGLIDQHAQENLASAEQTAATLEEEIKSTEDKLKLISKLPEIMDGSTESCNQKLAEIAGLNPRISNIGRVGIDKKFKCSLNKVLIGTDAEKLGPYISQIFSDPIHKPVMSRVIKVPAGGYAVALHVPVYGENGLFIGTVGGAIYFDEFSKKFLQDIKVSDQGYVVLQDDDGTIFYHPQKELIGQNRRPKTSQEVATASAITNMIIKSTKDGSSGTARYISTLDNKEKVGSYAAAEVSAGRRWIVIVTVPIEKILAAPIITESRKVFEQLLVLFLVSIILSPIFLLIYLIQSVFKPIEKIGKAATEIGQGNLNIKIPVKSQDEIGKLANVFNDMAIKLKSSYQGLEEKVQAKTQELTKKLEEEELHKQATLNILEDLSEEKAKIAKEKAKDEAILTSIGDGMIVTDEHGAISKINNRAIEMLGFLENELLGKWITKTIVEINEDGSEVTPDKRAMTEALTDGKTVTKVVFYLRKDKTKFPAAITVTPIVIDKKPIGAIEIFRDITTENELAHLKDEFVSIASHELRTPMTAIKGLISMIFEGDYGPLNDNLKEPLTDVAHSTERLINLVNDMLNVSRIEAGRVKLNMSKFPVKGAIDEIVNVLQSIAKDKNIYLKSENIPSVDVQADTDKVKQILNNIIGNSLKFTDKGGITVSAKKSDDLVRIFVSDTGMGISKKDQEKLFGKFQQINSQQEGRPQGTGLGLYVSRELARKMGGDMWIEKSELGRGSIFAFSVPISGTDTAKKALDDTIKEANANPDQK